MPLVSEPILSDLDHTGLIGCECAACTGLPLQPDVTDVSGYYGMTDASLDPFAGTTFNGKQVWEVDRIAAHLNRTGGGFADGFNDTPVVGRQNNIGDDNSVITFGFFDTRAELLTNGYGYTAPNAQGVPTNYAFSEYFNFAPFTEAQRAAAREAMQGWDDVVAVSFREANANDADMNFGNLASAPTTQAYARIPTAALDAQLGGQIRELGGDSWYSASQASNFQLDEGGYGLQTLTHEIGHGIGLSHPGAYNAAPGLSITYGPNAEYAQDTRAYTVMSYFQGSSIPGTRHFDFNISTTVYSGVPLIHDIAAAQRIYGADMTTRTGDTTYGFNSNAGRDSFDFVKTPAPVMAIWDAGGNDTLDASGYATEQLIDLTPGSLSSIGGVTFENAPSFEQVNANRAAAGFPPILRSTYDANMAALRANPIIGRLTDNVGIAYGVTIENAVGGSGVDTIIGNDAANRLTGNAGNDLLSGRLGNDVLLGGLGDDVLVGGAGADELDGGDGFDRASYRDSATGVRVTVANGLATVTGDGAGDRFVGIEGFEGSLFDDVFTGGIGGDSFFGLAGNDSLVGNSGADTLEGGDGNDVLNGGNDADTLRGGAGDDQLEGGNGNDTLDGGLGTDRLLGGNDLDTLDGGDGDDFLDGGNDNDVLNGSAGSDRLLGQNGNDVLDGGAGIDVLLGGNGNDVLNGGLGDDQLTGGSGADVFSFLDLGGTDTITDFRRGSDKIDLSGLDAISGNEGDDAFTFIGDGLFSNKAGELRSFVENGRAFVAGDVNGDGVADFTILVSGDQPVPQTDIIFN